MNYESSEFTGNQIATSIYQEKYSQKFKQGQTVLDIGCGEGVFLSLLKENGVSGIGVDIDQENVDFCISHGLQAIKADVLIFLESDKNDKYDGIFCSHLIEHLEPTQALRLIKASFAKLKDGGQLIIITPNPENIEVITKVFWLDITHVRPYPLDLLKAMFKQTGFSIQSAGEDADTGRQTIKEHRLSYWISKLRFGKYFGGGDLVIIGRK